MTAPRTRIKLLLGIFCGEMRSVVYKGDVRIKNLYETLL